MSSVGVFGSFVFNDTHQRRFWIFGPSASIAMIPHYLNDVFHEYSRYLVSMMSVCERIIQ